MAQDVESMPLHFVPVAADLADVEEAPSANIENASSKDDENAMSYFEKLAQE